MSVYLLLQWVLQCFWNNFLTIIWSIDLITYVLIQILYQHQHTGNRCFVRFNAIAHNSCQATILNAISQLHIIPRGNKNIFITRYNNWRKNTQTFIPISWSWWFEVPTGKKKAFTRENKFIQSARSTCSHKYEKCSTKTVILTLWEKFRISIN